MRLSGYMILGFLAMTLASFVEIFYLGRVGTEAIAAVTFAFPILMIIGAATRGIGVGIGAVLARAIGAGDRERAAFLTTHGLLLVLAFNIACSVFLVAFAQPLFHLLGAREAVLDLVVAYIRISAIGYPLFGLSMVGTGLMRAIGDPVYPGIVITAGSVLASPDWAVPDLRLAGPTRPRRGRRGLVVRDRPVRVVPDRRVLVLHPGAHDPRIAGRDSGHLRGRSCMSACRP